MSAIGFYRLPQVQTCTGLGRSSVYAAIRDGLLPEGVAIGRRAIGYPRHEVDATNAARLGGVSDAQIRTLVATLKANRQEPVGP